MWNRGDISQSGFDSIMKASPLFERTRLNWLAHAEVSLRPNSDRIGLSWFFTDTFEFNAFASEFALPSHLLEVANRLYSKLDLVPRLWLKMHMQGGEIEGYSQYFIVNPTIEYPLTTLRLGLKMLGLADVSRIAPAFKSVLGQADSLWAVIAKLNGDEISPRISCFVQRSSFPDLVKDVVDAGFLTSQMAETILATDRQILAGPQAYFSLDLNQVDAYSVDYVDLEAVPSEVMPLFGELPGRRYLKVRYAKPDSNPELTIYRPFPDVVSLAKDHVSVDDVSKLYDRLNPEIQASYGKTYQAGDTPDGTFLQQIAALAEIEPNYIVVDAGCGSGGPAVVIAGYVPTARIFGITISAGQAETASNYVSESGLAESITIAKGDYHRQPFASDNVDRVLFLESLGYGDLPVVLSEAFRILKPGGKIYIKEPLVKPGSLSSQETYELAEFDRVYGQQTPSIDAVESALVEAGFRVERSRSFGTELDASIFTKRMFGPGGLNPLGKEIYRAYQCLPIDFYEVLAVK